MAKAINWPLAFRDEILAEDAESLRIALRLGTLYYENRYWVPDEVVDIRVNHLKVRQAVIIGDLRQCAIGALNAQDYAQLKSTLHSRDNVLSFLAANYEKPVDNDTLVTVVTYRNLPVVAEEIER
jgi:hypothetical protein